MWFPIERDRPRNRREQKRNPGIPHRRTTVLNASRVAARPPLCTPGFGSIYSNGSVLFRSSHNENYVGIKYQVGLDHRVPGVSLRAPRFFRYVCSLCITLRYVLSAASRYKVHKRVFASRCTTVRKLALKRLHDRDALFVDKNRQELANISLRDLSLSLYLARARVFEPE